jgi:DNA mismatch repair protein MutH
MSHLCKPPSRMGSHSDLTLAASVALRQHVGLSGEEVRHKFRRRLWLILVGERACLGDVN